AEDGIRDFHVTGVQTCALPIYGFWLDLDELSQGILQAAGYGYCTAQADIQIGELLRCQLGCRIHGSAGLGNNDLGETKLRNGLRSEERRVGEEGRSRGARDHRE